MTKSDSRYGRKNMIGPRVRVARLRGRAVITQQDLSARLAVLGIDIDRTAISKIEAGERLVADFELLALARALGVSVDWLLGV
jgi:HTH-type transcriptional regulator, cell division transcriptional repressor